MSRTIKNSGTVGIRLSNPGDNPVTIAAGADIAAKGAFGLYGVAPTSWTLTNLGTVTGSSQGIHLRAGGKVINGGAHDTTASLSGGVDGVWIAGAAGTVVNNASIDGYRYTRSGSGTVFTASRAGTGVELDHGGLVNNGAAYAGATIFGGRYGVRATGAATTVVNAGAIIGDGTRTDSYVSNPHELLVTGGGEGLALLAGGSVRNGTASGSAALIKGGATGVAIAGGSGGVTNDGTILADTKSEGDYAGHYFYYGSGTGAALGGGGLIGNAAGATIAGGLDGIQIAGQRGTVLNGGSISGIGEYRYYGAAAYPRQVYLGTGIGMAAGGAVMNTGASASIVGGRCGLSISGGSGTVVNDGLIRGLGTLIGAAGPAMPVNAAAGAIAASLADGATSVAGTAVLLADGGSVTNATGSALIEGGAAGITVALAAGTVVNDGTILASGTLTAGFTTASGVGVAMSAGGTVTNGASGFTAALISGSAYGVSIAGVPGAVVNDGTIIGTGGYPVLVTGVLLSAGGNVVNGQLGVTHAAIIGETYGVLIGGAYGTVFNDATITGSTGLGVSIAGDGTVSNGQEGAHRALISGYDFGVEIQGSLGVVANVGTIEAVGYWNYSYRGNYRVISSHIPRAVAVGIVGNGTVTNGTDAPPALISGNSYAVSIGGQGEVINDATILSFGVGYKSYESATEEYETFPTTGTGVFIGNGGTVVNGTTTDRNARITGGDWGVRISGNPGLVENDGTIVSSYYVDSPHNIDSDDGAVALMAGGTVVNAAGAQIQAVQYGVAIGGASGSVATYGTIISFEAGVVLGAAGKVINGSTSVTDALIKADVGIRVSGGFGTVGNDGTIIATIDGVAVENGGKVNNGFYDVTSALISATKTGIYIGGGSATAINSGTIIGGVGVVFGTGATSATLENRGTITGTSGIAVQLVGANDTLTVAPGELGVLGGTVVGANQGSNTLVLAAGTVAGTITGLGTEFQNFQTLGLARNAAWSLTGNNAEGTNFGIDLAASGTLGVAGTLSVADTLTLAGPGVLDVTSGGSVVVGAGGTAAAGVLTVGAARGTLASGTLTGNGVIAGTIADGGTMVAEGGTLTLQGGVSGTGLAEIDVGAVLVAEQGFAASRLEFVFGGNETLALGSPSEMTSLMSGFGTGDTIDLLGEIATSASFSNTTQILTVKDAARTLAQLHFAGSYGPTAFHLASDGAHGTNILLN